MTRTKCLGNIGISISTRLGVPLLFLAACGGSGEGLATESFLEVLGNGLSVNGLSVNGLSVNGLSFNGLSVNGLSTPAFNNWFDSNPASLSNLIMKYVVRCAVPAEQNLTFTATAGGTYSWSGLLGLAPDWATGAPATVVEQQLVSACLAAHVNKFGVNVPISVLGYDGTGTPIPMGPTELTDYPVKEGCFFGNLFNGDGVFVGNDSTWSVSDSSSRDCAITHFRKPNNNCPPMTFAGRCGDLCSPNAFHNSYFSCRYNGNSYMVVNTRIPQNVLYYCGDGICQVSEQCGNGITPNNCKDCGPCH